MDVVRTKKDSPPRILLHADHGIGKSSLAAAAPDALFIQTEDGLDSIEANAFPLCASYNMMLDQLGQVLTEDHTYKTLVIDSLDWTETLINQHVCEQGGKRSLADFSYGAGFQATLEAFGEIITALNAIRARKGMIIILTAHSQIKTYNNPLGSDYDMHKIKLREKNAELFLEWCDLVGFMHFQTYIKSDDKKKGGFSDRTKVIGGTDRVISCAPNAAYVSKNRYSITEDIQAPSPQEGWTNLVNAIKGL
jgi:hypothetical protein